MSGPWQKFTLDDWKNARYCGECGLPLIQDEETKKWLCVYCTWVEDEEIITRQAVLKIEQEKKDAVQEVNNNFAIMKSQLQQEIQRLQKELKWQDPRTDQPEPGTEYEVWQHDLFTTDRYNEGLYWESGIEPTWFRVISHPTTKGVTNGNVYY